VGTEEEVTGVGEVTEEEDVTMISDVVVATVAVLVMRIVIDHLNQDLTLDIMSEFLVRKFHISKFQYPD
jgi:hypothetical protein